MKKFIVSLFTVMLLLTVLGTLPAYGDIPFHPNMKVGYHDEPASQEETTIASFGNTLVAGYHHIIENTTTLTTEIYCAVSYSHDGGQTWHSSLMALPAGYSKACDPAVAVAQDGTFYYTQLSLGTDYQVFLSRSDDQGVTWTTPALVNGAGLAGHSLDKEWVAAQGDDVYVTFTDFSAASGTDIYFVRSTDRGVTFGTPIALNDSGTCNGSMPFPDGDNIYVFWKNFSNDRFYMARSTDRGATFEAADILVADLNALDYPGFRTTGQFPSVTVDTSSHRIFCVYMDGLTPGDPSDIFLTVSDDSGSTWSTPARVNDDAVGNGQWFPWIDIDTAGTCHIVWYDERNNTDSLGDNLDLYYCTYDQDAATFGANQRVTDTTFAVTLPPEPGIATFIGDYIGMTYQDYAHALWMDSRGGTQDAFTSGYTTTLPLKVHLMMVNDVSGSMSWDSSIPGIPKIDPVKEDAELVLDLMRDGSGDDPQDKLGMAQFASGLRDFSDDDAPILPTVSHIPLTPVTATFRDELSDYIEEMFGSGGTSIASGLQKAVDEFVANPDAEAQNAVILLSDGHETANPRVDQDLINDLRDQDARCFTLGYGTDPYIDEALLFDIAAQTGGIYHYADSDSPAVIQDLYIKILASILDGDPIVDPIHPMTPGSAPATEKALITEADHTAYFIMGWTRPGLARQMSLSLVAPGAGGITIDKNNVAGFSNIQYIVGDTYICYKVRFPFANGQAGPGQWQMVARRSGSGSDVEEVNVVSFVQSGLKMAATFTKYQYGSGDHITLRAKLHQNGQPITGAYVYLDGSLPLQSVGNVLSLNSLSRSQDAYMKKLLRTRPDLDKKAAKLITLLDTSQGDLFPREQKSKLKLYDDGQHDDLAAGDGIYGDTFTFTETPGTYSFLVSAECESLGGYKALRQRHASLYQKVTVDGDLTVAAVTSYRLPDPVQGKAGYKVTVTPKDRFGNYLGPGYAHLVQFNATMGKFQPVIDHNDGTYSAVLVADENRLVRIGATIDGVSTTKRPVAGPPSRTGAGKLHLSMHLGRAVPLGTFAADYSAGYTAVLDLERVLTKRFSLRVLAGYNRFAAKNFLSKDTSIWNFNLNLCYRTSLGAFQLFVEAGPGFYVLAHDAADRFGVNAGLRLRYALTSNLFLELGSQYHSIFTTPDNTLFSNLFSGLVFRF